MKKLFASDLSDKRMIYAVEYLSKMGFERVNNVENADVELLPPKAKKTPKSVDYLGNESFAVKNAYLTAEGAIALAVTESDLSLISSKILIVGFGRIGKALLNLLKPFTSDITVCARSKEQRIEAKMNNAKVCDLTALKQENDYDFVFNTVPFPVLNDKELKTMKRSTLIIDLASFPGGVDKHIASSLGIKLIHALGIPAKYSPKTAGKYVAEAVKEIAEEGII